MTSDLYYLCNYCGLEVDEYGLELSDKGLDGRELADEDSDVVLCRDCYEWEENGCPEEVADD